MGLTVTHPQLFLLFLCLSQPIIAYKCIIQRHKSKLMANDDEMNETHTSDLLIMRIK